VVLCKPLSRATKSGLYLIHHQQNAVFVTDFAQGVHKCWWCRYIAAFALLWLQDDGGSFFGSGLAF